jgi:hypothetical protein
MIGYSINKGYKQLFCWTALEIKSSVGAKPISMYGLIEHSNPLINLLVSKAFSYFEPKMEWQERNPFKIKTHHGTAFQLFGAMLILNSVSAP